MSNLTLHVFWIGFMPVFEHAIGERHYHPAQLTGTLFDGYENARGRPPIGWASILITDIVFGVFCSPTLLYPLPAAICSGLLCGSVEGVYFGLVLVYQCVVQVGMSVTFTLHYKYTTIVQMTNSRRITVIEKNGVQLFYFILLETVIASLYICWEAKHELRDYLIEQAGSNLFFRRKKLFANQQFALVRILDNNDKLTGAAYMMPDSLWKPFSIMCITIFALVVTVAGCFYFVLHTLKLLSGKKSSMSEKTRKMQQKLMYTLLMQIGIPFGFQIGPMFIHMISMIMFWFTPGWMNFFLCVQLCHASFHTIFLISTTPSYRNVFIRFLNIRKTVVTPLNSGAMTAIK